MTLFQANNYLTCFLMSFSDKAVSTSEPYLFRISEGHVTDALPASIGLGDCLFTRMANILAQENKISSD